MPRRGMTPPSRCGIPEPAWLVTVIIWAWVATEFLVIQSLGPILDRLFPRAVALPCYFALAWVAGIISMCSIATGHSKCSVTAFGSSATLNHPGAIGCGPMIVPVSPLSKKEEPYGATALILIRVPGGKLALIPQWLAEGRSSRLDFATILAGRLRTVHFRAVQRETLVMRYIRPVLPKIRNKVSLNLI